MILSFINHHLSIIKMQNYLDLLQHILDNGTDKTDRTHRNWNTKRFGYQLRYDLSKVSFGNDKKVHLKSIIYELFGFKRRYQH